MFRTDAHNAGRKTSYTVDSLRTVLGQDSFRNVKPGSKTRESHFVECDDGGAAQPQVVLQRELGARNLPLVREALQLPAQLGALRQS